MCNGNFLFHKLSKTGGHIHYKIYGNDIYIKNLGYLWVINDFDLISEEDENTCMYNDYLVAMEAFVNYHTNKKFNTLFEEILKIIHSNRDSEKLFYNLQHIWSLTKPKYKKNILNKEPYII